MNVNTDRLELLKREREIILSLRCLSFNHRDMILARYDREIKAEELNTGKESE